MEATDKTEKRKEQLRQAQIRYRQKHLTKKNNEEAQEAQIQSEPEKVKEIPKSYTAEYRQTYYKNYYETHKEKLLTRSKERYVKKADRVCVPTEEK
jgi:hypothetical protein